MIVVVLRHTVRLVHDRHGRRGGRPLGTLNPPLHLAHRVQVVAHHVLIARAELTLQLLHALGDGIKDAAVDLHLGTPYLGAAVVTEQPLEHHARITLVRERQTWRTP